MPRHWNYRRGSQEELKPGTNKIKADKWPEREKKRMIREKEGKIEYN